MSVFSKIFQVLMDIIFGMAVYFGMNAFFSALNANVIAMISWPQLQLLQSS